MARTKASVGAKVSSGKSSKARAVCAPPPSASPASAGGGTNRSSYSGGNSVCPRETPNWQKPITRFFQQAEENGDAVEDGEVAGSSKEEEIRTKRKSRNVITSDDEDEVPESTTPSAAPNVPQIDLDHSSPDLPPLDGEDSHKIAEYFPKVPQTDIIKVKIPLSKNKGKGGKKSNKKADDKENEESGSAEEAKNVVKRMASDGESGDETASSNKRVKVQN